MDARAVALAIPFFLALIAAEVFVDRRRRRQAEARGERPERLYRFHDALTSLSCGIGQQVIAVAITGAILIAVYSLAFEHLRIGTWPSDASPMGIASWAAAFLLVDLCYYGYHLASHRINFFWASHVVHHQSEEYNLTTALRQSWLTGFTSWVFYLPLAILGVPLHVFLICLTANILYQFWIHTRVVGRLGPLELVLNTPSHHRVHHGIDPEYIDKNYAGVLIVWDRLFGTFTPEEREPAYGTVKPLRSFNPFWANLEGFARIVDIARRTRRPIDKLYAFWAPPEWMPDDLGGVQVVPPVASDRKLFDVTPRRAVNHYLSAQFVVSAVGIGLLLWFQGELSPIERGVAVALLLATLGAFGGLVEQRRFAVALECARLAGLGAFGLALFGATALGLVGPALAALSAIGLALSLRAPAREIAETTEGALTS